MNANQTRAHGMGVSYDADLANLDANAVQMARQQRDIQAAQDERIIAHLSKENARLRRNWLWTMAALGVVLVWVGGVLASTPQMFQP